MVQWRWRLSRDRAGRRLIVTLVVAAVAAVCVTVAGCTASGASTGRGGTPTSAASPLPTSTANPLTPTPTPTEARLNALVSQAIGGGAPQVQTRYNVETGMADVAIMLGGTVPAETDVSATQERVKALCFDAQHALWTSHAVPLNQVNVAVVGPVIDQYADITNQAYGSALLISSTAARLNWGGLDPAGAWNAYDNVYLRDAYNDAD